MSVQICKNGNANANGFSNSILNNYDTNFYVEPDGSVWIRVAHHNNPANAKFANTNSFSSCVYLDTDRWFNVSLCNVNTNSKWELMYKQKQLATSTEEKYRFIQTVNPMKANFEQTKATNVTKITDGYNTSSYGGVFYLNSNSYLVGNNGSATNWFGAIGCWSTWNNGIPGYNGNGIKTGYIDLYYRVDTIDMKSFKLFDSGIVASEFIEI